MLDIPDVRLKKCPFCAGEAKFFVDNYRSDDYESEIYIACTKCDAKQKKYPMYAWKQFKGNFSVQEESENKAIEEWNRRA